MSISRSDPDTRQRRRRIGLASACPLPARTPATPRDRHRLDEVSHRGASTTGRRPASLDACRRRPRHRHVYNLASDMGGMGFIEANRAACMISVLINTHLLIAGRTKASSGTSSSSACVYNVDLQQVSEVTALREEDAYPALPEDGYGWEKLFSERMCRNFQDDYGIETRVARYHNVYGPHGRTTAGARRRRRRSAARSPRRSSAGNEIEIWGDGSRPQLHVHRRLPPRHDADHGERHPRPINLGSSELVTINQLVDIVPRRSRA